MDPAPATLTTSKEGAQQLADQGRFPAELLSREYHQLQHQQPHQQSQQLTPDMPTSSGESNLSSDFDFDSDSEFGAAFFQGGEGSEPGDFGDSGDSGDSGDFWNFRSRSDPDQDLDSDPGLDDSDPFSNGLPGSVSSPALSSSGLMTPPPSPPRQLLGGTDLELDSESEASSSVMQRGPVGGDDTCPATAGANTTVASNDPHQIEPIAQGSTQYSSVLTYAIHIFLSVTIVAVLLPTLRLLRAHFDAYYMADAGPRTWFGSFELNSTMFSVGSTMGSVIEEQTYGVCGLREDLRFAASFLLGCLITYVVRGGQLERRGDTKVLDILALLL